MEYNTIITGFEVNAFIRVPEKYNIYMYLTFGSVTIILFEGQIILSL